MNYTYKILTGTPAVNVSTALPDINDNGVLLGSFQDSGAFLWRPPYGWRDVVNLTIPVPYAYARGLNNLNDVCGYNSKGGFTFIGGKYTRIVHPKDTTNSTTLQDINDKRQAVGWYTCGSGNYCSFILDIATKTFTDIPLNSGGVSYQAFGINNDGVVSGTSSSYGCNFFLYKAGKVTNYNIPMANQVFVGTVRISNSGLVLAAIIGQYPGSRSSYYFETSAFVVPTTSTISSGFHITFGRSPQGINAQGQLCGTYGPNHPLNNSAFVATLGTSSFMPPPPSPRPRPPSPPPTRPHP
jgi:hypothetical protein